MRAVTVRMVPLPNRFWFKRFGPRSIWHVPEAHFTTQNSLMDMHMDSKPGGAGSIPREGTFVFLYSVGMFC